MPLVGKFTPLVPRALLSNMSRYLNTQAGNTSTTVIDGAGVQIPSAYISNSNPTTETTQRLHELLKLNNERYSPLFKNGNLHNHVPHSLVSAYYLGADVEHLNKFYQVSTGPLDPWEKHKVEFNDSNWTEKRGSGQYQAERHKFFSEKIAAANGDWRAVAKKYIVDEKDNLFPGLIGGVLHPLIHLGYAVEMDDPLVAAEALTIASEHYINVNPYFVEMPDVQKTTDALEVLDELHNDPSLDGKIARPRAIQTKEIPVKFSERASYYRNRLEILKDPSEQIGPLMKAMATLFGAAHKDNDPQYDFFLLHCLTAMHATAEIIMSPVGQQVIPKERHADLVRDLWSAACNVYLGQQRPKIDPKRIEAVALVNDSVTESWQKVNYDVLNNCHYDDHAVKIIRALLFAEMLTGDKSGFFAKIGLAFTKRFGEHGAYQGFGQPENFPLDVKL